MSHGAQTQMVLATGPNEKHDGTREWGRCESLVNRYAFDSFIIQVARHLNPTVEICDKTLREIEKITSDHLSRTLEVFVTKSVEDSMFNMYTTDAWNRLRSHSMRTPGGCASLEPNAHFHLYCVGETASVEELDEGRS